MFTGQGRDYCGEVCFNDLAVPEAVLNAVPRNCERLDLAALSGRLGLRNRADHKGRNGHVLVVGGELGMGGAGILAARAAGRAGAGLVSLATRAPHVAAALAQAPELMVSAVASGQDLQPLLKAATVVVVGPGLGRGSWAEQLLLQCWRSEKPLVLDADALNLLAERPQAGMASRQEWVITPHPGEAARLLGWSVAKVQADRFAAARELQSRLRTQVLLKGSGSLIVDSAGSLALCPYGNPGMATGGMGDVLSGVIGALLAQGMEPAFALRLATVVHACAADLAVTDGERGLLAGDLLPLIRKLLNPELQVEAAAGGR